MLFKMTKIGSLPCLACLTVIESGSSESSKHTRMEEARVKWTQLIN